MRQIGFFLLAFFKVFFKQQTQSFHSILPLKVDKVKNLVLACKQALISL